MPAVRSIVHGAARENYRFSSLILGIVNSPQFQANAKIKIDELPAEEAP